MVPNTYSPNLSIAWWSLFTLWSRGQGLSPVESVWLSLQEIRNNKQTQTESNELGHISLPQEARPLSSCMYPSQPRLLSLLFFGYPCIFPIHSSFFFFFLKERKEVVKDINSMDTWLYSKPLSVTLWDKQGRDLFPCSEGLQITELCALTKTLSDGTCGT